MMHIHIFNGLTFPYTSYILFRFSGFDIYHWCESGRSVSALHQARKFKGAAGNLRKAAGDHCTS